MKNFIFSFFLITLSNVSYTQITIDNTTYSKTQLVSSVLAPAGNGVVISNVTTRGVYNVGSRYQVGYFSTSGSVQTSLGLASGVVLSSGNTSDIPLSPLTTHPGAAAQISRNYVSGTTGEIRASNGSSGQDADVNLLASPDNYYNASILEFDFVPSNTNVSFRYVFGSEEYMDNGGSINYNCSSYNDKFAFLISGPGINSSAGYANNAENIAILSNGSKVSINSVNNGVVGSSGGAPSASRCSAANSNWVQNSPTSEFNGAIYGINFNGNTKVLTAGRSGLTAGATYHIRMIVTDVGDGAYDSGVFIEAGSFLSPIVMPIQLSHFEANCISDGIELIWETVREENNRAFYIEKSADGINYETIGKINSLGQSSGIFSYKFNDLSFEIKPVYYRIKQVDINGFQSFSKVIFSDCKSEIQSEYEVALFPNPSENNTTIEFYLSRTDNILIEVSDEIGKVILNKKINESELNEGKNSVDLNVSEYAPGFYNVKVTVGNNIKTLKLIVK